MNHAIVFVYTTIGGVIGAVATQCLTHIRDRRAARALVIQHIGKVEAAYASLRITLCIDTKSVNPLPQMDEFLSPLEAAALIAGISRRILQFYINAVRINYEFRRMEVVADGFSLRLVKSIPQLIEYDKSFDPAKVREYMREGFSMMKDLRQFAADARYEELRQTALQLLSTAIWHPLGVQLFRKKISQLDGSIKKLDSMRCTLAAINEKFEGKTNLTNHLLHLIDKKITADSE